MNRRQRLLARMVRQVDVLVVRRWFCLQRLMARLLRASLWREHLKSPYYKLTGRWGWRFKWAWAFRE